VQVVDNSATSIKNYDSKLPEHYLMRRSAAKRSRVVLMLACVVASTTASPARANDDCVKLVFNVVCLGGTADTLPRSTGTVPEGGNGELQFENRDKKVHVELADGRIVHVWREEPPGSWINYLDWRNKLIRVYGRGLEEKDFPPSATSRSSRLNAVVQGEGRAATSWEQTGWHVAVIWDNQEYVQLSYRLQNPTEAGGRGSEGL